ncbi:hypothetical protein FQN49_003946 [Arthroderma sp. PD_2]|nr:hypothetical protein FQN49_003946 [Arthroderma sp. PD_2]
MYQSPKLPDDPMLARLLLVVRQLSGSGKMIHDVVGFEKSYPELLGDILRTRDLLRAQLPALAFNERGILCKESQYIAILSRSCYEFVVAFFAIRSVGGACIPLPSGILPKEARHFLSKARSTCIVAGRDSVEKAGKICATTISEPIVLIPVSSNAPPQENIDIRLDNGLQLNPDGPGAVMMTSGTTGRPKGVILPRRSFGIPAISAPGSVGIHCRAMHWLSVTLGLLETILAGMELYSIGEGASARDVLETFKRYRITDASFTPVLLRQMRELLAGGSGELPKESWGEVYGHFKGLSKLVCAAGTLDQSTHQFWVSLTGLPIQNVYGITELGGILFTGGSKVEGSMGNPVPGIQVKLTEGDHGELRIKSPRRLIGYLGDEKSTKAAFDEEGYFKTGDLAELKDDTYIFRGRAAADYILYHFFRISALTVESSLMDLPYISEACVLGAPHREARELCVAIVRVRCGEKTPAQIRSDLSRSLPPFMLPTALRILTAEEVLPRTVSDKPIKRRILEEYFGTTDWFSASNLPRGVGYWGLDQIDDVREGETKSWDWCGLQFAS